MINPGSIDKPRPSFRISALLLAFSLAGSPAVHAQKAKPPVKQPSLSARLATAVQKQNESQVRALLEAGAEVNTPDAEGHVPLAYAAFFGSAAICRLLIERGALVNPPGDDFPPLYHALTANRVAAAQLLLEKGATLKWNPAFELSPLRIAVSVKSIALIDLLVKKGVELDPSALQFAITETEVAVVERLLAVGIDPNVRDEDGKTPLILSTELKKLDFVDVLIKHKADVNAKDAVGKTALMYASGAGSERIIARLKQAGAREFQPTLAEAVKQMDSRAVRALLKQGGDANEVDEEGKTPLFHAVAGGDENMVKALLEKGANPEARDKSGKSVLATAREAGNRSAINLLLEAGVESPETALADALMALDLPRAKKALSAGADVNVPDENGRSMLMIAITMGYKMPPMEVIDLLLAHGADVNTPEPHSKDRILNNAVATGSIELVRKLLDRGADPKAQDENGYAPLHYIDQGGDTIARLLIERGADVRAQTKGGQTVLMSTAQHGTPEAVRLVLERGGAADLKEVDSSGFTALHGAAGAGNAGAVKLLLERGADVNAAAGDAKLTPLGSAVSGFQKEGDYVGTVRILLSRGAHVNTRDDAGRPLLDAAKKLGNPEMITLLKGAGARSSPPPSVHSELARAVMKSNYLAAERLLKIKKVDPNRTEGYEYTPLMTASLRGDLEMVKLLLAHGARPNQRMPGTGGNANLEHPSALQMAAEDGEVEIVQLLLKKGADPNARWLDETPLIAAAQKRQYEACRVLIAAGANINAQFNQGRTALSEAAMSRDPRLLKLLLQKGARIEAVSHGSTPLLWATAFGNTETARLLLEAGANPKATTAEGDTTLMGAATSGSLELIQLLLAKGVDVNARNRSNQTALSLAEDNAHDEAAELLKRTGAKP